MEDIFKQFRDHLESRPEPSFEEQDWLDLQKRLDRKRKKRLAGFAWQWLALPCLLLLLGSNTLFYLELRQANQRIERLDLRQDTIVLTRVIYRTDTIYQTRVIRESSSEYIPVLTSASPGHPERNLLPEQPYFKGPATDNQASGQAPPTLPVMDSDRLKGPGHRGITECVEQLPPALATPENRTPALLPVGISVELMAAKRKKTARYYLHEMRPKEFRLGAQGGWCYPFSKNLTRQSGYSAGLQATTRFSPNLEMWLDAGYYKMRFETDSMYEGIGVPVVTPPSDEFTFIKAEVPVPFLQFSIGMQYLFRSGHKWKPFLGVGYGAVLLLPSEVIYEFQNTALGIEWNFDREINRREWQTDFLLLRAGFEYELARHWSWQLHANYRAGLGDSKLHSPPLLGLQGGLEYRF